MKKILLTMLFGLSVSPCFAGGLLDLGGIGDLVATVAKGARGASLIDANANVAGGLYVPVLTLHTNPDNPADRIDLLEFGAGAQLVNDRGLPLVEAAFNIPGMLNAIFSTNFLKSHIEILNLPPIFIGPFVRLPLPGLVHEWTLKSQIGLMASVGLGSSK